MHAIIQASLAQIETKKSEIVRRTMGMSEADRATSSSDAQWSAAQVVEHLVMYKEFLLAGHEKALEVGNSLQPGLKGRVFVGVIGLLIRAKVRFGTTKEFEPALPIDLEKRLQDWCEVRETLSSELDKIPASNIGATFAIHPIAGPISAEATVRLISLHLDYHIRFFPFHSQ